MEALELEPLKGAEELKSNRFTLNSSFHLFEPQNVQ
jgi:hypothetical protein